MSELLENKFKKDHEKFKDYEFNADKDTYKGRCATFQSSMKLTILIGQLFGLIPVQGVSDIDTFKLRFKFFSMRCFYTLLSIFGQSTLCGFCLYNFFYDSNVPLSTKSTLIFMSSNMITTVLFLRIATKWPKLCQHISMIEAADPNTNLSVVRKCNFYCLLILFMAFIEHSLCDLAGLVYIIHCQPQEKQLQTFVIASFPYVFEIVNYNPIIGILALFINIQCTFNWNFANIFVICISLYLTSRLNQVTNKIAAVKGKYVPPSVWRNIREDYNRTTSLVRRLDDIIGSILFVSFSNNLFFICLQMLHTLADGIKPTPPCKYPDERPLRGYEQATYFMYSLIFLMLRSLAVSLIAADVHTASRRPVFALYEISSAEYCIEVHRLIQQIHGETVALSGLQFFKVKRGLLLAIAGTVATYELVLLQFAGVTPTAAAPVSNSA